MGKGKGNFKRWCTILYPGRVFIEHSNISPKVYSNYLKKINIKLKVQLKIMHIASKYLKTQTINDGLISSSNLFECIRVRKCLFK